MAKNDNAKLAQKIVEQKAQVVKQKGSDGAEGHMVDLLTVVGWVQWYEGSESIARKAAAKDLATQLDDGTLSLSNTWAEDNLN